MIELTLALIFVQEDAAAKLDAFAAKHAAAKKADAAKDWWELARWIDEEMRGAFEPPAKEKKGGDFNERIGRLFNEALDGLDAPAPMSLSKLLAEHEKARRKGTVTELARSVGPATVDGLMRHSLERVIEKDADHELARRRLGFLRVDGKWRTEAELMLERGLMRFEGQWLSPDQVDRILDARRAAAQAKSAEERAKPCARCGKRPCCCDR
jgi:hypothetical protein